MTPSHVEPCVLDFLFDSIIFSIYSWDSSIVETISDPCTFSSQQIKVIIKSDDLASGDGMGGMDGGCV